MPNAVYIVMKVEGGRTTLTGVTEDPMETVVEVMQNAVQAMARQMAEEAWAAQQLNGADAKAARSDPTEPGETPVCGIHDVPMVWVDKNGGFWSCHEKNSDGTWCKYRPSRR